jgi:hypothetical protein
MAEDLMGKVISFLAGDNTEHLSDKDVILRQRHKELSENKHAKFFHAKTDEIDPSLAMFFYSIYKIILPLRAFMRDTAKMIHLRKIVLEAFMDSSVPDTVNRLNPESIGERVRTTAAADLTAEIQADIDALSNAFSDSCIAGANRCYTMVMALFQLVNYDYPALLRKFDTNFTESQVGVEPKFAALKADQAARGISEFLAVSQAVNPEGDWKTLLELLGICAGQELVSLEHFSTMVFSLRDVLHSKVLELIVQVAIKNPIWEAKPRIPDEHIGEAWLEQRIVQARACIDQINNKQRSGQISALARQIFDTVELTLPLENYVAQKNRVFQEKGLEHFAYAEGLNYLLVFLTDFLEREVHELCDILLIRGQWTNIASSKEMSEALHFLLEIPARITELDELLSDEGGDGSRLKAALLRVDRDKTQARYINSIVDGNNDTALEIINSSAQQFIVIGKHLKSLIEDVQKKHPELLINWRELNLASKDPLAQRMIDDYKKINYFVQLMRLCTQ